MIDRCPWWIRWHHRQQRQTDRLVMLPALSQAVRAADGRTGSFSELWSRFKAQPGQEHWHCPCATAEAMANLRAVLDADDAA